MGKAEMKKKEKAVEDKTFGLKNKNRSAKVQAYVQNVTKSTMQKNPKDRKGAYDQEARKKAKEEKKAFEAEMAKLFNSVDGGRPNVKDAPPGEDDPNFGCNPDDYLFRPEDFDEVEHDDRRLEEQLEAEREELKGRTDLTPVTEESFQAWKAQKRAEAVEREAARVRRARAQDGKLRGWDLWQMDRDLFVDDENANEVYEREEENEECEDDYDLE